MHPKGSIGPTGPQVAKTLRAVAVGTWKQSLAVEACYCLVHAEGVLWGF